MSTQEMTVFVCDRTEAPELKSSKYMRVISKIHTYPVQDTKRAFFLCPASKLPEISRLISDLNRVHRLKALFVKQDVSSTLFFHIIEKASLRTFRNMIVHSGNDVPRRVLSAWKNNAQDKLIANADVAGETLYVRACDLTRYEIPIAKIKPLSGLSEKQLKDFEIDEDGSFLYWKAADLHLDLDSLKYIIDPAWKRKKDREAILYNKFFGRAIALLRERMGLRQADIKGVSERQIRRIESGMIPHSTTLDRIAKDHKLELNEYLIEIANIIGSLSNR